MMIDILHVHEKEKWIIPLDYSKLNEIEKWAVSIHF